MNESKSREAYPQHLTRDAIAEALINTPYDEPFSEADAAWRMMGGFSWPAYTGLAATPFMQSALKAAYQAQLDEWAASMRLLTDTINNVAVLLDFKTAWLTSADWAAIPAEPRPTSFAEALAAKRKRDTHKARERNRDAIRRGRHARGTPESEPEHWLSKIRLPIPDAPRH